MMEGLTFKIIGKRELQERIRGMRNRIASDLKDVLNKNAAFMITYLRTDKLVDKTTPTTLASRSMQLKRSLRPIPAKATGEGVLSSGVSVGTPYAKVHFGPRGTVFPIVPRNRQFLTVPLPAARDSRGIAKAPARSDMWGPTFIRNGVIFGYKGGAAKVAGRARQVVPLFKLVKRVEIPRRIFPSQIFTKLQPRVLEDIREVVNKWPRV